MTLRNRLVPRLAATLAAMALMGTAVAEAPVTVTAASFQCMTSMTPVRGFYVANLLGKLDETLKAARAPEGAVYPVGSVVQLVPTEVMVKQPKGTNAATRDWEFFELDVSPQGSTIRHRGYTDVINRFGGNCLGCHAAAKPQWDLICEQEHGCAPVPLTREMIEKLQREDPRCTAATAARPKT